MAGKSNPKSNTVQASIGLCLNRFWPIHLGLSSRHCSGAPFTVGEEEQFNDYRSMLLLWFGPSIDHCIILPALSQYLTRDDSKRFNLLQGTAVVDKMTKNFVEHLIRL
jgi:hypothetical protein